MSNKMVSLYDYLGRAAGSELGKQVASYAKLVNAKFGTKKVSISPYKDGTIMTYEKSFLDQFFKVKSIFTPTELISVKLEDESLPF